MGICYSSHSKLIQISYSLERSMATICISGLLIMIGCTIVHKEFVADND